MRFMLWTATLFLAGCKISGNVVCEHNIMPGHTIRANIKFGHQQEKVTVKESKSKDKLTVIHSL